MRRLWELPGPEPGTPPGRYSSCCYFHCAVLKIGGCERKRLLKIIGLKLGVVPEEVAPVRIDCHRFNDSTNCKPHAADTRLSVHLVRVPGYAIKALHILYSDTFNVRCPNAG